MSEDTNASISISIGAPFILAIIGYLVYGTLQGAVSIFIVSAVLSALAGLGGIPFVGFAVFHVAAAGYVMPWLMNFLPIEPTWLTHVMFWFFQAAAFIATVGTTIAVIVVATLGGAAVKSWLS
jgi:hypothetical protein